MAEDVVTSSPTPTAFPEARPEAATAVRSQIRGSGLLLAGRAIATGLTTLTQVLIVRHLATDDFGAWAYALAVVMFWQSLANLGFHEAVTRFVPIYHQRRDYSRLFGTILLCGGFILLSGTLVIVAFYAWPDKVLALVHQQGPSLKVLFVLIFMVPTEALDGLLMGLFASFAAARSIFARRHVLGPLLRLAVVLLLIVLHADVLFLAYGYLAATAVGIGLYAWILARYFHREGLFAQVRLRDIRLPMREVFSFTVPMMTADVLVILIQSVAVLLLGYYHGMREVAFYRVVLPAAAMNQTVAITSALLYLPAAARLFAAGDSAGLRQLYWRTATWVVVLSFPIFALTFAFAQPVTVLLYGQRYADAGVLLAILAAGYYFDVVFGFNGLTLKAMNKLGYLVGSNLAAAAVGIALDLLLIPRYGALGAAIGTAVILIVSTALRQLALGLVLGTGVFPRKFLAFYAPMVLAVVALMFIHPLVRTSLPLAAVLALIVVASVLLLARRELNISEVFPEGARIPLVGRFLSWSPGNPTAVAD
jgi:O-antigen/teichoic acid export membrane protein